MEIVGIIRRHFVSRGGLPPHMGESHPAIDAMECGKDVADDIDSGHGGVGGEPGYGAVVVEQVAEHRVGESAGGAQEEATGRCVIDHLLTIYLIREGFRKKREKVWSFAKPGGGLRGG